VTVAIVAAHPDDEVIGAGLLLPVFAPSLAVIYVTDGAPRTGDDARKAGCASWREYADLRRRESLSALAAAGAGGATVFRLNCPDQRAAFRIAENTFNLLEIFGMVRPELVLTHAYEGGHPDHDATAASVHAAAWLSRRQFRLLEFAGYHSGPGGMECECFPDRSADVLERRLTKEQSSWKRKILNCYASQAAVLRQFPLGNEPLRPAVSCNFTAAPHEGQLYYERFGWGISPPEWRHLARDAFNRLAVPCAC
jgi:LmbE family N-acetylglucosaminyl deacetylase